MTPENPQVFSTSVEDDRSSIERRADAVRFQLGRTLEMLDQRRHRALDVRRQVRTHVGGIVAAGAAALLALAIGAIAYIRRLAHAREHRRAERYDMVRRVWEHPERIARTRPRPSFLRQLGRSVVLGLVTRLVRSRLETRMA